MKKGKMAVLITLCCVVGAILAVILFCDGFVVGNASGRTYDNVEEIPHNKYGLLLGTVPVTPEGEHNYSYENRMIAAEELYKAGKIDTIIASGGISRKGTPFEIDEPQSMKDSLIARGVPAEKILLDYEGTRTLKSIQNAKNRYNLDCMTLISQKYHNERAMFLADRKGIATIGYNARQTPVLYKKIKNGGREYLARVKMFIDLAREK